MIRPQRRRFLKTLAGLSSIVLLRPPVALASPIIKKSIPSSGERLPAIGLGTWLTFDVNEAALAQTQLLPVLQTFFDHGGALIDSSPMYGASEEVIGDLLPLVKNKPALFAASKVWTLGQNRGINQMEASRKLWGVARFDLMHIHNMLDWEAHLETLKKWKSEGRVRYIGITTSHGRRHEAMEKVMAKEPFDFVQFTYNIIDREAEQRLLPLAAERGIGVIINRPFQGGALFNRVRNKPLPSWAAEFDCRNWAQFFLKFIIGHPAVTCAIPATSQAAHMLENIGAGQGRLPDAATRRRMVQYFESL